MGQDNRTQRDLGQELSRELLLQIEEGFLPVGSVNIGRSGTQMVEQAQRLFR